MQSIKQAIVSCLILLATYSAQSQSFTISGYVRDENSGESLIGANIFDTKSKRGTVTNTFGYYTLSLPSDSVNLAVTFVGYQNIKHEFLLSENVVQHFKLESGEYLEGVVITAEESIELRTEMSTMKIPVKQIKSVPAILGETDVLKVLQLLPGVQSGVEGSSGIYVRGGGPDQNLILLDGVPIYNAAHLFGAFSVFNADAINNVELTKGGFPARYGGRLSSVLDITMKEGNNQKFKGTGSIGLIASKLTFEGPIGGPNTSFLVSGRRTYMDVLARPIVKLASQGREKAGYHFYDLNAKINHKFSDKDRMFISMYSGLDKAFQSSEYFYVHENIRYDNLNKNTLGWGNLISALRWNHVFTPKLFANTTITYSQYNFDITSKTTDKTTTVDEISENHFFTGYNSGINDIAAKLDLEYHPSPNHNIRFGTNAIWHKFSPGATVIKSNMEIDTTMGASSSYAMEIATYIEDDFSIGNRTKFNLGVHASGFLLDEKTYTSIQPRIALRYLISPKMSFKASYATMTQYIHLLTNSGVGLPTDLWVPSTTTVKPQTSWQVAAGLAKSISSSYEVSIEGYYKEMDNLISYKEGSSFLNTNDDWSSKVVSGSGESYGGELFLQKKTGKFSGWLGYTLSWTNRQFEALNFGEKFPYKYDRRHDFSLVGMYKVNERIELAATWVYGTGNSLTLPTKSYSGFYYSLSLDHYDGRNAFRMAAYHRLGASISFTKQKKWGERAWVFGLYNAYSRSNPFYVTIEWDYETPSKHFVQYSLFPVIPSFSYNFKF